MAFEGIIRWEKDAVYEDDSFGLTGELKSIVQISQYLHFADKISNWSWTKLELAYYYA